MVSVVICCEWRNFTPPLIYAPSNCQLSQQEKAAEWTEFVLIPLMISIPFQQFQSRHRGCHIASLWIVSSSDQVKICLLFNIFEWILNAVKVIFGVCLECLFTTLDCRMDKQSILWLNRRSIWIEYRMSVMVHFCPVGPRKVMSHVQLRAKQDRPFSFLQKPHGFPVAWYSFKMISQLGMLYGKFRRRQRKKHRRSLRSVMRMKRIAHIFLVELKQMVASLPWGPADGLVLQRCLNTVRGHKNAATTTATHAYYLPPTYLQYLVCLRGGSSRTQDVLPQLLLENFWRLWILV